MIGDVKNVHDAGVTRAVVNEAAEARDVVGELAHFFTRIDEIREGSVGGVSGAAEHNDIILEELEELGHEAAT